MSRIASRARLPLLAGALLAVLSQAECGTFSEIGSQHTQVAYVIDGDTFATTDGDRIRLLGINTPEIEHDTQPAEPFGYEAKRKLTDLIQGAIVTLKIDMDRHDDYHRLLAQVYLRDGTWVNALLVREGYAHVYTFAPNFRWTGELLQAEDIARSAGLGIWKEPRFRVVRATQADGELIGQFRVLEGKVSRASGWAFRLANIEVTVPRKYRQWFDGPLALDNGEKVRIRGFVRASRQQKLFIALHSPYDLQVIP